MYKHMGKEEEKGLSVTPCRFRMIKTMDVPVCYRNPCTYGMYFWDTRWFRMLKTMVVYLLETHVPIERLFETPGSLLTLKDHVSRNTSTYRP